MEAERYQPEIDGLRAVAILPVVLFHAGVPDARGGFIGVDIFFVLSGFLITRLLLVDLQRTGRIEFAAFYARRVRRLWPALATVVAATLVAGAFILSPVLEQPELAKSAIATMALVANVFFWHARSSYFAGPIFGLPLLNMWTLSVEEQFYLIWPALLLFASIVARRMARPLPLAVGIMLFVLFAASIVLGWWFALARPIDAFYLTPMRGWEFALGAMLVVAEPFLPRFSRIGALLAAAGFALIVPAVLRSQPVAGWFEAAFGTAAVIAGITASPASIPSRLLQMRPLVVIGKLSYSWYLWHWPLLVLDGVLVPGDTSLIRALTLVGLAFVLAALTFVFIEDPIRRGRPWPFARAGQTLAAGGTLSLVVGGLAGLLLVHANAATRGDPWLSALAAAGHRIPPVPGCNMDMTRTFTALASASQCAFGSAGTPPRILVWGDSQAEQLKGMMTADGERGGYASVIWSMSACGTVEAPDRHSALTDACRTFNRAVAAQLPMLAQAGVTGILLATRSFDFPGERALAEKRAAWISAIQDVLAQARRVHMRVLFLAPLPIFPSPLPQCLAHASPVQCGGNRSQFELHRAPLLAALAEFVADDVRIWDPFPLLCDAQTCTPLREGVIMYSDRGHLSVAGARTLAPFIAPDLAWLRGR